MKNKIIKKLAKSTADIKNPGGMNSLWDGKTFNVQLTGNEISFLTEQILSTEPEAMGEKCPACFGVGFEEGNGEYGIERCLVCGGEGTLPHPKPVEPKQPSNTAVGMSEKPFDAKNWFVQHYLDTYKDYTDLPEGRKFGWDFIQILTLIKDVHESLTSTNQQTEGECKCTEPPTKEDVIIRLCGECNKIVNEK